MVISAREALRSIERAISGSQQEEDRMTEMLRTAIDDAARLRNQQADSLKALARMRLTAIAASTATERLDAAEKRALEALRGHALRLASAATDVKRAAATLATAEVERDEAADNASRAADAVDGLADQVYADIHENREWGAQTARLANAESTAVAAEKKAVQAETDREEKGRPYETDKLFLYLWQRGFGTPSYEAGLVARYFDSKIAGLIGFGNARIDYHMLNEIPLRLREHAQLQQSATIDEQNALARIERAVLIAAGIEPLEEAADAADDIFGDTEDKVEDLRQDQAGAMQEHAILTDDRRDPQLQAAITALAEEMGREDLTRLLSEALRTPSRKDEQIVQSLRDVERKLERREAEAEEVRKAAVELAKKRTELEQSRDHFRQSGFDDPRGQFDNGDMIAAAVESVVRGILSSGGLNKALRDGFSRRAPKAGRSFGGGVRTRRSWGGSGGMSGRSSGGFKTGGGF